MKQKQDTLLAVRVPRELAEVMRFLAEADERTLSSWIKLAIRNEIRRSKKGQGHRHPIAA